MLFSTSLTVFAENSGIFESRVINFVEQNQDTMAAMSVSIFSNQDVLFEQSFGYINIAERVANDSEAVFEWASVSKLLVPVSVMQLVERGLLDLNADISEYLPNDFLTKLSYDDPITMLHLLNHTAGFQETFLIWNPTGGDIPSLDEALMMFEPPQIFRPGEVTAYSNYGTALAGHIVEIISGKHFYAYIHENIFVPLGMTRTALLTDLSDNIWVRTQRGNIQCYTSDMQNMGTANFMTYLYPSGMATGTLSDLRKFGQALLPDEAGMSPLFRYPETLSQLHTPTSYYPNGITGRNYHGFWSMPHLADIVIGHEGNTSMSSVLLIDIENNFGAAVMTNQAHERIFNKQMMGIIFGEGDFSQLENSGNDVRVSGIFRASRGLQRGIFKSIGLINLRPFSQPDENTLTSLSLFTSYRVAPGIYRSEGYNDMSVLFFVAADESGNVQYVTAGSTDYVRMNLGVTIFEVVSLLLFVIAGIYSLVMVVTILLRKIHKKGQYQPNMRIGIYSVSFLALVNFIMFFLNTTSTTITQTMVAVHGIMFILFALVIVTFVVLFALRTISTNLTKMQKLQGVAAFVAGVIMVINIIYWQLWMFWI